MARWLELIRGWSKDADSIAARDSYSMGLFILVLAGISFQLPLILNIIIQLCFLIVTLHCAYCYVKAGHYLMALLKIGLIVAVALGDDIYFRILLSK